jgi:hypothetical protein
MSSKTTKIIPLIITVLFLSYTNVIGQAFTDETASAGLNFSHDGTSHPDATNEFGTGAAWFDYNNDGNLDLYVTMRLEANKLFHNNGDGTFTDVAADVGLQDAANDGAGVAVADYNNDGWQDIYLANGEKDKFFRNVNGTFIDVTIDAGFDWNHASRGTSASWGDYDIDGYLDLYVAHHEPVDGVSNGDTEDRLYHNNGDGTFTNVTELLSAAGNIVGNGFIGGWTDYDNDGDLDIFVVNDCLSPNLITNKIFRNDGDTHPTLDWNFTEVSEVLGVTGCHNGMGIAVGDYNRDGWMDVFHTDAGEFNLWKNNSGNYSFETNTADLEVNNIHVYTWGTFFFDYDLDGWQDLYISAGTLHNSSDDFPEPNYLFHNNGNGLNFTNTSAEMEMDDDARGRTTIFGDYDNDGDPDVFTVNYGEPVMLRRNNNNNGNHYLKIHLVGTVSNFDGIGSRIKVSTPDGLHQYFETRSGSSLGGGDAIDAYFGLGSNTSVLSVEVTWPSGIVQTETNISADQYLTLQEPYDPCAIVSFDAPEVESATICADEPIPTFTATVGAGLEVDWYDTPEGGNLLAQNSLTYTPDNGSTFYAVARDLVDGCISNPTQVTLTVLEIPVVDAGADQAKCLGESFDFSVSVTGPGGNYDYDWTDNLSNGPDLQVTPIQTTTYGVTVTANNGCATIDEVTATVNELPSVLAGDDVTICKEECYTFQPFAFGGNPPYSYDWSGDDDTMACPEDTTVYTLIVTDDFGCAGQDEMQINVSPLLAVEAGEDLSICAGECYTFDPVVFGGVAPFTIEWSTEETTVCPTGGTYIYSVTVTDENGCTAVDEIGIIVFEPVLAPLLDYTICENSCVTITASELGFTGFVESDTIVSFIELCEEGFFSEPALDGNGCMTNVLISVATLSLPNVDAGLDQILNCIETEVTIGQEQESGMSYEWSNGELTSSQQVTEPGLYILTATNTLPGCSVSDTVEVFIDIQTPFVDAGFDIQLTCAGPVAILDGSGSIDGPSFIYTWTTEDGNILTGGDTIYPEIDSPGTYLLTVLNTENGCSSSDEVVVSMAEAPTITIEEKIDILCEGEETGVITVSGEGGTPGYIYLWSNGETTATIDSLPPGVYAVTVTDQSFCEVVIDIEINAPPALVLELIAIAETSNGAQDGQINAVVSGGTPDYFYEWNTGSTDTIISGLAPDLYFLTVLDSNGCMTVDSARVNSFDCENIEVMTNGDFTVCPGDSTGSIQIEEIVGGEAPYIVLWSTNENGNEISGLVAGHYSSTITDAQNCEIIVQFEITESDTIPPTILSNDIVVYLDENGDASFMPEMMDGGSFDNCSDINFVGDEIEVNCSNIGSFAQMFIISDEAGLLDSSFVTVTVLDTINPVLVSCPDDMVTVNCEEVVYELPTASDNCQVSAMTLIEGLPSGDSFPVGTTDVSYSAQDNSGNSIICNFSVTLENTLAAVAELGSYTCEPENPFLATITASGGEPNYAYEWDDGNTTAENLLAGAGPWSWTVTDSQGCQQTGTMEAEIPDTLTITLVATPETEMEMNGAIDATVTGGGEVSFEWRDETGAIFDTGEDLTGIPAGVYCLTVFDSLECMYMACVEVENITSTIDQELNTNIEIAPNPTSGLLSVKFDLLQKEAAVLTLLDINGKVIHQLQKKLEEEIVNLDMSLYAEGVYLLKIIVGERIVVKKVMVGH